MHGQRMLHPSAIGKIISSLPRLERLTLKLNTPRTKRAEMRNEHRIGRALLPFANREFLLTASSPCECLGFTIIKQFANVEYLYWARHPTQPQLQEPTWWSQISGWWCVEHCHSQVDGENSPDGSESHWILAGLSCAIRWKRNLPLS